MAGNAIAVRQMTEIPVNHPAVIDYDIAALGKSLNREQRAVIEAMLPVFGFTANRDPHSVAGGQGDLGRAVRLKPLGKPLLFNMARSGKSPYLSMKEVYELGFDYALCPIEPMFAMHKAVKEMMEIFLREGSTNAIADRLTPFDEFNKFIGLPEMAAREKRFSS